MNLFDIGLQNVGTGKRGAEGQYCLINVSTVENGGSGQNADRSSVSNDRSVNVLEGATRNSRSGSALNIVTSAALPMPTNVRIDYSAEWSMDNTSILEQTYAGATSGYMQGTGVTTDLSKNVGSQSMNLVAQMANSSGFRKAAQGVSNQAHNPHKELFYGGPAFRTFPLEWSFSFENKKEADKFDEFVAVMSQHMHPDFVEGATAGVWKIPDTFFVEFVNAKVRRAGACVLTSMNINYVNGGSGWKAFTDGNPAHVSLVMALMEIAPRTRADIKAGM